MTIIDWLTMHLHIALLAQAVLMDVLEDDRFSCSLHLR